MKRCVICGASLPERSRSDRRTCSAKCRVALSRRLAPRYSPETCCACRWVVWNQDCGHPESDGITSPHQHCALHRA